MRIKMMIPALAAATVMGGVAVAQKGNEVPAPEQAATQANSSLSKTDLPKFLEGLGYDYEKVDDGVYRVTVQQGKWKFKVNVSLSDNLKKLWMSSYLAEIKDINQVPAASLAKLLTSNADIGPAHFYINNQQTKWLKMGYALDNRNITPRFFREELDWFTGRLTETSDLWSSVAAPEQAAK